MGTVSGGTKRTLGMAWVVVAGVVAVLDGMLGCA
jgi:hypothetical protein